MARTPNTDRGGTTFGLVTQELVWLQAIIISTEDKNECRLDRCGTKIRRGEFGKAVACGWEIDHIKPIARGGTDDPLNLEALHWRTNREKGDAYPWDCR